MSKVRERVLDFPKQPGVYIMKNEAEKVLYVGKAKSLRSRVLSYFSEAKDVAPKTRFLISHVFEIEYILTKTEVEAFLLEASLIKKYRPKYNIRLKDDKAYPYIKVSMADSFARLYLSRRVKNDGGVYFGPYTASYAVRGTMRFLNENFKIRDCQDAVFRSRKRPCMTYQIGRCDAPCVSLVTKEDYRLGVDRAMAFLSGDDVRVREDLERKMHIEAEFERFENAARIRDSLKSIERILDQQVAILDRDSKDMDVVVYHGDHRGTLVYMLYLRSGRLIGHKSHFLNRLDHTSEGENPQEWLISFLNQYYDDNVIPHLVLLDIDLGFDLSQLFSSVMRERKGENVLLRVALSEQEQSLVKRAKTQAEDEFETQVKKATDKTEALLRIQKKFKLSEFPHRIECFDVSNFQGSENVASQVVLEDGVPNPGEYRKYRIKGFEGQNDFASMKEVLERRLAHAEWPKPQMLLIDGGKGQLNIVVRVLEQLGRNDIPVVGLAKARTLSHFQGDELEGSEERFFLPGRSNPVLFSKYSEEYKMLVGLRDEAHRFAITFHRDRRHKALVQSVLDEIPGLGPDKRKALLTQFESLNAIRDSNLEDLCKVQGVTPKLARKILEHLAERLSDGSSE